MHHNPRIYHLYTRYNETDASRLRTLYKSRIPIAIEGRSKPLLFWQSGNSIRRSWASHENYVKLNERNLTYDLCNTMYLCKSYRKVCTFKTIDTVQNTFFFTHTTIKIFTFLIYETSFFNFNAENYIEINENNIYIMPFN